MATRTKIAIYSAIAVLFIVSAVLYAIASPDGEVITIKSDGRIVDKINLSTISDEYETIVENNGYNKLKITPDGVGVIEADCPDKLCIKQSESGVYPVICLPHRLVIEKE